MPQIKIAMVVSVFPVISETFIANKFLGLQDNDVETHIVCQRFDKTAWKQYGLKENFKKNIHIQRPAHPKVIAASLFPILLLKCLFLKPFQTMSYLIAGFRDFEWNIFRKFYLDAELILLKPDLIHFEFGALAVGKTYLKKLLKCKLVVSFRGYDINFSGIEEPDYYQEVWKNTDAVHCLGQNLWTQTKKRGCPEGKPHVLIPPAINTELFKSEPRNNPVSIGTPERPLRLLSVGRLEWKKGYGFSLHAASVLNENQISFEYHIIGKGSYLEDLVFCAHQLGLDKEIVFLGAKSPKEVLEQMQWADIFVHSAVSEGFCNAVIEAQAMQLPVVCSDAGGLPENITDGKTGFVVPRRNPEALAERLIQLARDPNLRNQMGEQGRHRALMFYQLSDQLKVFRDFYSSTFQL